MEFISVGILGGLVVSLTDWIAVQVREASIAYRFIKDLQQQEHFYISPRGVDIDFQWAKAGETAKKWQRCVLLVAPETLNIYLYPPKIGSKPIVSIDPQELRGFWRPEPYHDNRNEVWIHAELQQEWQILKLRS